MNKDFCIERIHAMLNDATPEQISLVYRFLCGLIYKNIRNV